MPFTGYLYYGARIMDPTTGGRWLNIDPAAAEYPSWSPYSYVLNNPIRFIDPDGMRVNDRWKGTVDNDGNVSYEWISDEGGDQTDYVDYVDEDGNSLGLERIGC